MSATATAPSGGIDAQLGAQVRETVERTIQRAIKGVEYIASPGPALGFSPKDVVLKRGTLSLYHYRALDTFLLKRTAYLIISVNITRCMI